jgi:predicted permease
MDSLAAIGFSCLGIFVGLIVGWFVNSEKEPNPKSYSSIIFAVGSTAASFIPLFSPKVGREIFLYPVALLTGLLIATFFDVAYNWFYGLKWVKAVNKKAES